jgi:hypothetical protein
MKEALYLVVLLLVLLFYNCVPSKLRISSTPKTGILRNNYSIEDTLFIKNTILCNNIGSRYLWMEFIKMQKILETDTLFEMFFKSMSKLNLPIIIDEPINHCDTVLDFIFPFRVEKIDSNRIKEITQKSLHHKNKVTIFPIIHIDNISRQASGITSTGMPIGGYYIKTVFLEIAIYVIKNEEITDFI